MFIIFSQQTSLHTLTVAVKFKMFRLFEPFQKMKRLSLLVFAFTTNWNQKMFKFIKTVTINTALTSIIFFPICLDYFEKQKIQPVINKFSGKVQNSKELEETIEIFALTIWCEARSEGIDAMIAVADVIMNRVNFKYFPQNVKEVVLQENQFLCWAENKLVYQINNKIDKEYLDIAREIAAHRLNSDYSKYKKKTNALFFVHKSLHKKLYWTKKYKKELVIGELVFYFTNKL